METTAAEARRGAYASVRLALQDMQRVTAPINRGRYTEAQRDQALANLEAANAAYRALESL